MMAAVSTIEGRFPDWRVILDDGRPLHLRVERGEAVVTDLTSKEVLWAMRHNDYCGVTTWKEACHALARMGYRFARRMTVREVLDA